MDSIHSAVGAVLGFRFWSGTALFLSRPSAGRNGRDAKPSRQRILKQGNGGRKKGKPEEKQRNQRQRADGKDAKDAAWRQAFFQKAADEKGGQIRRKKNEKVAPERMGSRDARAGIEQDGDEDKAGKKAEGSGR